MPAGAREGGVGDADRTRGQSDDETMLPPMRTASNANHTTDIVALFLPIPPESIFDPMTVPELTPANATEIHAEAALMSGVPWSRSGEEGATAPCEWIHATGVEMANRAKDSHRTLCADWAVGRSFDPCATTGMLRDDGQMVANHQSDDGLWILGNTFEEFTASKTNSSWTGGEVMRETQVKELCTYDKYLEGAYREGVLRRLLTSVLGEKSVMEKILVDKEVMVFPAHVCGGTHFVGIAIHPGRKIVGFWDGLFSVSVANEAKWKPALLAALAAAGEDVITWTFYSNLATTDQGELIQHDEITLPGDREGWDYRSIAGSIRGAFQCGALLHWFADIFVAWCALPDLMCGTLREFVRQKQSQAGIIDQHGNFHGVGYVTYFRRYRTLLARQILTLGRPVLAPPMPLPAQPFVPGCGTELQPDATVDTDGNASTNATTVIPPISNAITTVTTVLAAGAALHAQLAVPAITPAMAAAATLQVNQIKDKLGEIQRQLPEYKQQADQTDPSQRRRHRPSKKPKWLIPDGGTVPGTALMSMYQRLLAEKPEEKILQEWIDQAPNVEVKPASVEGNGLFAKVDLRRGFRLKMYGKPLTMQQ